MMTYQKLEIKNWNNILLSNNYRLPFEHQYWKINGSKWSSLKIMMMIDVLRPLLCRWQAKWADRPLKVMKRCQRWNTLQICPRQDSNWGGSDLWSKALPTRPWRWPSSLKKKHGLTGSHNFTCCHFSCSFVFLFLDDNGMRLLLWLLWILLVTRRWLLMLAILTCYRGNQWYETRFFLKWKMKQPSDIAQPGLNPGAIDLWPTMLPVRPLQTPGNSIKNSCNWNTGRNKINTFLLLDC